jgi:hypothetical protein
MMTVAQGKHAFNRSSSHHIDTLWGLQLEEMRKNEDPRLSFSTPEFKEAQRMFTDGFKVRFCLHLAVSDLAPALIPD